MTLAEELQQAKATIAALQAQNGLLLERVANLEAQLALNSRNSSKPPSSDGFKRPPPLKHHKKDQTPPKASAKKSGGQAGHTGHTLAWNEQPDHTIAHFPSHCQSCHADLTHSTPLSCEKRQVLDLPHQLRLQTVEHQAFVKQCSACHTFSQAPFPSQAANWLQYGPNLRALAVYLSQVQLLPYARSCEVIRELFGAELNEGTLAQMIAQCHAQLAEPQALIQQGLVEAPVAHNDETGLYVAGRRLWLHVMSTAELTFYAYHPKRGKAATDAIGLLPKFKGVSVHDGWASYYGNEQCQHALCNAHHLRELSFVGQELKQAWANELIELLLELKAAVASAKSERPAATTLSSVDLSQGSRRYRELIAAGLAANPPPPGGWPKNSRGRPKQSKAKNLVDRLDVHEGEVLAFAHNFKVPFDNNQAERDLRMVKVQQKVSGCFRSEAGASNFCGIRSYISTMRKQGHSAFKALRQAFLGEPLLPSLPA